MSQSATLAVKGTVYYSAPSLLAAGALSPGTALSLRHEKKNPHDSNAVAVHVRATGAKLGHIARDYAPKYAAIVDQGMIIEAKIKSVSNKGARPTIHFTVFYRELSPSGNANTPRLQSLPEQAGVYAIWNSKTDRTYIGSSTDIKHRVTRHFQELRSGAHSNRLLQEDFNSFGSSAFSASTVTLCEKLSLASREAQEITKLLSSNRRLYNSTPTGQGIGFKPKPFGMHRSASDKKIPIPSKWVTDKPQQSRSGCLGVALIGLIGLSCLIGYAANLV